MNNLIIETSNLCKCYGVNMVVSLILQDSGVYTGVCSDFCIIHSLWGA